MVVVGRKQIQETQLQLSAGKYTASSTTKIVVEGTGETPSPIFEKKEKQMESNLNETQKRQLLEKKRASAEKVKKARTAQT